jgi:hypothetical protein
MSHVDILYKGKDILKKTDPFLRMLESCRLILVLTRFLKNLNFNFGTGNSGLRREGKPRPFGYLTSPPPFCPITNYGPVLHIYLLKNFFYHELFLLFASAYLKEEVRSISYF